MPNSGLGKNEHRLHSTLLPGSQLLSARLPPIQLTVTCVLIIDKSLKIDAAFSSDMLTTIYQTISHRNPEDRRTSVHGLSKRYLSLPLLRAFAKLRTTTVSFDMSVCPSVHLSARNNSALTGRIFVKLDI
jgi:hypothetical protein